MRGAMAAAESGDSWVQRTREREERMRFEVLAMVYRAAQGNADAVIRVSGFLQELGVWYEELFRVVEFLDRCGYLSYQGAGPLVRITPRGIRLIEGEAGARRSIRD